MYAHETNELKQEFPHLCRGFLACKNRPSSEGRPMPSSRACEIEVEVRVRLAPECKPTLIDLMAQAIVAVWHSAQEADHDEH